MKTERGTTRAAGSVPPLETDAIAASWVTYSTTKEDS